MEGPNSPVRVMIVEDDHDMLERFARAVSSDPRTRMVENARTGGEAMSGRIDRVI